MSPESERISASEVAHLRQIRKEIEAINLISQENYQHIVQFYRLDRNLDTLDEETGIITRGVPAPVQPEVSSDAQEETPSDVIGEG